MGSSILRLFHPYLEDERVSKIFADSTGMTLPAFDVPYFKYIDEDSEDEWSNPSQSSVEEDTIKSSLSNRYVVVAGTPEKILEHLLNDIHLEEGECKETGKHTNLAIKSNKYIYF